MIGRVIQNKSAGSFFGIVLREKDHGVMKGALTQGGISNQQLAFEAYWCVIAGRISHAGSVNAARGCVKGAPGVEESGLGMRGRYFEVQLTTISD